MPHFVVSDQSQPQPPGEAISFELGGEVFACLDPPIPFGPLVDLLRLADIEGDFAQILTNAHAIEGLVVAVLRDDDGDTVLDPSTNEQISIGGSSEHRWRKLRSDKRRKVDVVQMAGIAKQLMPLYMGIPTQPASSSPGGSLPANGTSGPAFANLGSTLPSSPPTQPSPSPTPT